MFIKKKLKISEQITKEKSLFNEVFYIKYLNIVRVVKMRMLQWALYTSLLLEAKIVYIESVEITNKMQPCNRIYYSKIY
jgi:hypothetical protein